GERGDESFDSSASKATASKRASKRVQALDVHGSTLPKPAPLGPCVFPSRSLLTSRVTSALRFDHLRAVSQHNARISDASPNRFKTRAPRARRGLAGHRGRPDACEPTDHRGPCQTAATPRGRTFPGGWHIGWRHGSRSGGGLLPLVHEVTRAASRRF